MNDTLWTESLRSTSDVDRRESRAIRLTSLAVAGLLIVAILVTYLGLLRPSLAFQGSSTATWPEGADPLTVHLDVRNRGLVAESVLDLEIDYPGVEVVAARLEPSPLPAFATGQLVVDLAFDCAARTPQGEPAWSEDALADTGATTRIATSRPWGRASAELLESDLTNWVALSMAPDVCAGR